MTLRRRLASALAALVVAVVLPARSASATEHLDADVLIQAGHEGRPDCDREPASLCNNTGAPQLPPGEIHWTPIVADETTRILRAAGISVLREPAYLATTYAVRDAIFIHFDGSEAACATGASIGYPKGSGALAAAWRALYQPYWPFRFMPDNFTPTLAGYYGYHHVTASDGQLVVELGEMSCAAQHAWMQDRLRWEGALLAHFLSERLGKGNIPLPRR